MSQIPSAASIRARRGDHRYAECPVCHARDVNGNHVDDCQTNDRYRRESIELAASYDIPLVAADDLWAHLRSRTYNCVTATAAFAAFADLGWRPVVGSDESRLWAAASPAVVPDDDAAGGAS